MVIFIRIGHGLCTESALLMKIVMGYEYVVD